MVADSPTRPAPPSARQPLTRAAHRLRHWWRGIIDMLFPHLCYACHRPLAIAERLVCPVCVEELRRIEPALWSRDEHVVYTERGVPPERYAVFARYSRENIAARLVHSLKYHHGIHLGVLMGRWAAEELEQTHFFDGVEVLVPIPVAPRHRRERGFNQAELIAQGISQVTGIPICPDAMCRLRNTESQTHFDYSARNERLSGAFALTDKASTLSGRRVLLIDDVITTGATMRSAISTLAEVPDIRIGVFAWSRA